MKPTDRAIVCNRFVVTREEAEILLRLFPGDVMPDEYPAGYSRALGATLYGYFSMNFGIIEKYKPARPKRERLAATTFVIGKQLGVGRMRRHQPIPLAFQYEREADGWIPELRERFDEATS